MSLRSCGDCTACCHVLEVSGLRKPARQTCEHVCETGCAIYQDRPGQCRDFECAWLQDRASRFRDSERPDKLGGAVVSTTNEEMRKRYGMFALVIHLPDEVDPRAPGPLRTMINRLAKRIVVIGAGRTDRRVLGGPPSEVAKWARAIREAYGG